MDSDRGRNPVLTKSITLGELTDSIIAKDYSPNPFMPLRQPPFMQHRPELTDMWKMNRRIQQQQLSRNAAAAEQHSRNAAAESRNAAAAAAAASSRSAASESRNTVSDSRSYHESVTPPENYHYGGVQSMNSRVAQQPPRFALDCYVKTVIAEAMRTTEDEKLRAEEFHDAQRRTPQRSTPDMVIDDDASTTGTRSSSNAPTSTPHILPKSFIYPSHLADINSAHSPQPPVTTFTTTTYAYPYSALNVSGTTASLPPPIKTAIDSERSNQPPPQEPKPLLSAQYEALSDED